MQRGVTQPDRFSREVIFVYPSEVTRQVDVDGRRVGELAAGDLLYLMVRKALVIARTADAGDVLYATAPAENSADVRMVLELSPGRPAFAQEFLMQGESLALIVNRGASK